LKKSLQALDAIPLARPFTLPAICRAIAGVAPGDSLADP
jgi:hypothetical protein